MELNVFNDVILDDDQIEILKGKKLALNDKNILAEISNFETMVRKVEFLIRGAKYQVRIKYLPRLSVFKTFYEKFGGDVEVEEIRKWFLKLKDLLISMKNDHKVGLSEELEENIDELISLCPND